MTATSVILIGLRGSGKSTIGRYVAGALGWEFVDLDDLTPRELGHANVAEAWSRLGEAPFRAAEVSVLSRVLQQDRRVIALGGGTPTAPGAAALLEKERTTGRAVIVYLRATAGVLRERLRKCDNSHRPALTPGATDPLSEIDLVLSRRDPLYRSLATAVVECGGREMQEIVRLVVDAAGEGVRAL